MRLLQLPIKKYLVHAEEAKLIQVVFYHDINDYLSATITNYVWGSAFKKNQYGTSWRMESLLAEHFSDAPLIHEFFLSSAKMASYVGRVKPKLKTGGKRKKWYILPAVLE